VASSPLYGEEKNGKTVIVNVKREIKVKFLDRYLTVIPTI